jgi:hypothetical protein
MRKPCIVSRAITRFRSCHRFLCGQTRLSISHSTSILADVRPASGASKSLLMDCFTVYCNSLLATLNARKGLRWTATRHEDISLSSCQATQQKTNHSFLGTTSKVSFLRNGAGHGFIISLAHAKQYFHQDQHYRRVHAGRGEQCVTTRSLLD